MQISASRNRQGISCPSCIEVDRGRIRGSVRLVCRRIQLLVFGMVLSASQALAAVPVEDRSSTGMAPPPRLEPTPIERESATPRSEGTPDYDSPVGEPAPSGLAQLFTELQSLRSEVQELRSTVEEQAHQLRRLETAQQEQYRDLDGRLAQLVRPGGEAPVSGSGRSAPSGTSSPADGQTGSAATAGGEKAAYAAAFESMKARQFDNSIDQFNRLIQDYPNGEMTPGSWYWLGELYLAKADLDQSRQSFSQVVNLYPSHNKAPDALYKMGVVYHRLGDNRQALEYLDRVQRDFPTSAAAGLAKTYASELR